ncbi:AraC-like transcriptional regulator QhpR [Aurantiacibacter suaedae]|uniref:AraC-like transcriptional regulator QhpR n=1 Tax=Aurantiacibacter suaedae TaxID=2545755 RepID=UPI001386CF8F|nr:AraC family transcriptional regulator [Aurantiacibacter suaedae]
MNQPQVLRSALHGWQQVFADCDFVESCPTSPVVDFGETMALVDFVGTLEAISGSAGVQALGWKVGEAVDLPHYGDIGRAVGSAQTLGAALRQMCTYFDLLQDLTELRLIDEGEFVALSYRILDPTIWPRHQDAIYTLAIKARIMFSACDFPQNEAEIFLETPDRTLAEQLERASGLTCHPGAESNMIRFPARCLALPMRPGRPFEPPKLSGLATSLKEKRRAKPIEDKVRATVYSRLGRSRVCQSVVAAELGLSDRTLRRRLAADNTSFQAIVDECRIRQAVLEITRQSSVSISEIALRLGYSEHSTFSRAFSRCMGIPPQAYLRGVSRGDDARLVRI